jgi:hypothetical protein
VTEPTIPSQPSPASLVILTGHALRPVLTVCVIFGGLSLSQEVAAGTESFRRSCTNIRVSQINGSTLIRANCDDGRSRESTWNHGGFEGFRNNPTQLVIPPNGCADVSNQRGELRCIGAEHPGGSWSRSCVEGRCIRGRVFQAVCAPAGTTTPGIYSSIDMNRCPSFRLENINGRLRCS